MMLLGLTIQSPPAWTEPLKEWLVLFGLMLGVILALVATYVWIRTLMDKTREVGKD